MCCCKKYNYEVISDHIILKCYKINLPEITSAYENCDMRKIFVSFLVIDSFTAILRKKILF